MNNIEMKTTNNNYGADYALIKHKIMNDYCLRQKYTNPIKPWMSWVDIGMGEIKEITEYLLRELILNEPVTSMTTTIPLINDDNIPLKVGIGLYMDNKCFYNTNENNNVTFISTEDLVNVLTELCLEDKDDMMRYCYHKIAWKLKIVDELKNNLKEKEKNGE